MPREISFQELHIKVGKISAALKTFGVKQGDRVAGKNAHTNDVTLLYTFSGYLPNCALAVEAMLATSSLGAIWCSTSPDFGVSVSNSILYICKGGDHNCHKIQRVVIYSAFRNLELQEIPKSLYV